MSARLDAPPMLCKDHQRNDVSQIETPPMTKAPLTYRIDAAERALRVLETVAEAPGCSLADLARSLELPKASVFRHLRVLEDRGYVVGEGDAKRYSLGPRLVHLGFVARSGLRLPQVAAPTLRALHERFNETVHVGVLSQHEVVHIETIPSTHPLKMASAVGERTFAHISALGKVLLAHSDTWIVQAVIEHRGLPRFTNATICDRGELQVELARVREQGYAIDDEESAVGLRCVACPIRDEGNQVIAALSLSSPVQRLSPEAADDLAPVLAAAAHDISTGLGWQRPTSPSAQAENQ